MFTQVLGFNESLLEPVHEVDSQASSDSEHMAPVPSDSNTQDNHRNAACVGTSRLSDNAVAADYGDYTVLAEQRNGGIRSDDNDLPPIVCPTPVAHVLARDNGDYVTLTEQSEMLAPPTSYACTRTLDTSVSYSLSHFNTSTLDNMPISVLANKTDETKSAEAYLLQNRHLTSVPHIVDPIPVTTANVATHKALFPTVTPARLFVNENSAFAKCKSIKRSVSDAGKGFFGRLRHKSKDSVSSNGDSESIASSVSDSRDSKMLVNGAHIKKSKMFSMKKHKLKSKRRHKSDDLSQSAVEIVDMEETVCNKPPVIKKEIVSSASSLSFKEKSQKSPVSKEVLSANDLWNLTAPVTRSKSPVLSAGESIEGFTEGICKMTSALHASSAESIAYICGCKAGDCCEKRTTPSPHGSCHSEEGRSRQYELDSGGLSVDRHSDTNREADDDHVCDLHADNECSDSGSDDENNESQCLLPKNNIGESSMLCEQLKRGKLSDKEHCRPKDCNTIGVASQTLAPQLVSWGDCSDTCDSDDESQCSCSCPGESDTSTQDTCSWDEDGDDLDDVADCSKMCIASPETARLPLSDLDSDSDSDIDSDRTSSSSSMSSSVSGRSRSCRGTLNSQEKVHVLQNAPNQEDGDQRGVELDLNSSIQSFNLMQEIESHVTDRNASVLMQRSFNAFTGNSDGSSPGKDSINLDNMTSCFKEEASPFSVSFQEVDFDNGDVMYMENPGCDDFKDLWSGNPNQDKYDNSPTHVYKPSAPAPVSSPLVGINKYTDSPVKYPINPNMDDNLNFSVKDQREVSNRQDVKAMRNSPKRMNDDNDASFSNASFGENSFSVRQNTSRGRPKPIGHDDCDMAAFFPEQTYNNTEHFNHSFCGSLQTMNNSQYSIKPSKLNSTFSGVERNLDNFDLRKETLRRAHSLKRNSVPVFSRNSSQYASYHGNSPCPSPLDLSMNKGRQSRTIHQGRQSDQHYNKKSETSHNSHFNQSLSESRLDQSLNSSHRNQSISSSRLDQSMSRSLSRESRSCSKVKGQQWMDSHVGQVFSPAKRALHKNRGVSESDLCKEILNLYVSDADESGFEVLDETLNMSQSAVTETSLNQAQGE